MISHARFLNFFFWSLLLVSDLFCREYHFRLLRNYHPTSRFFMIFHDFSVLNIIIMFPSRRNPPFRLLSQSGIRLLTDKYLDPADRGIGPNPGYQSKVRVIDRYKVIGFISSGTYGRVYKAVGRSGQTGEFAIKKFKPGFFYPSFPIWEVADHISRQGRRANSVYGHFPVSGPRNGPLFGIKSHECHSPHRNHPRR